MGAAQIGIIRRGEQVMNFSTDSLKSLLCTARRYMMMARDEDKGKLFAGYKIGRSGDRRPIELSANAGDIVEYVDGRSGRFDDAQTARWRTTPTT